MIAHKVLFASLLVLQESAAFNIVDADPGQEVEIVVVEKSRRINELQMAGTPGKVARGIGAGDGLWSQDPQETSREVMRKYLESEVSKSPKRLVILAHPDVMFGGCDEKEIVAAYNTTVQATGAPVVMGAQLGFWPTSLKGPTADMLFAALESRRRDVLRAHDLHEASFEAWAECSDEDADCSESRTYPYLNANFAMGPVDELLRHVTCMTEEDQTEEDDTDRALECMFKHGDRVTLDYSSKLFLSTWQFKRGVFRVEGQAVKNSVTGGKSCFVHINGNDGLGKNYYRKKAAKDELVASFATGEE